MRIFLGLVMLALAGTAALAGLRQARLWAVLRRVEVTTPEQLVQAARAGILRRRVCGVVGTAVAGAGGELTSTVNQELCVWHRHTIQHRQVRYRTNAKGQSRRSSHAKRAGDVRSPEAFILASATDRSSAGGVAAGGIEVRPDALRVDRPERRKDRILPGIASQPFPDAATLAGTGSVQNSYRHREWIIRAGTPLFVLGEVAGREARVVIRRPPKGPHLISTRGATQIRARARLGAVLALAVAAAATLTAVVYLVGA